MRIENYVAPPSGRGLNETRIVLGQPGLPPGHRPAKFVHVVGGTLGVFEAGLPRNIRLERRLEPGLWPVAVEVLANLPGHLIGVLRNAREAMPDGGTITVSMANGRNIEGSECSLRFGARPGRYVRLSVADSGEGIAISDQPRIFEPFFTTKPDGAGLGLFYVRDFVRAQGGFVTFWSAPENGSRFDLFFPATC